MEYLQLEFDFEKSELEKIRDEVKSNFNRVENVRRGVFKKHSLLANNITILQEEIESLKKQIEIIKNHFL